MRLRHKLESLFSLAEELESTFCQINKIIGEIEKEPGFLDFVKYVIVSSGDEYSRESLRDAPIGIEMDVSDFEFEGKVGYFVIFDNSRIDLTESDVNGVNERLRDTIAELDQVLLAAETPLEVIEGKIEILQKEIESLEEEKKYYKKGK